MGNRIQIKNKSIVIVIAIVIILVLYGYNKQDIKENSSNILDSQELDQGEIDFQFQNLKEVDVSSEYKALEKEYKKLKENLENPEFSDQYKYSLGEVYDLNKEYIGKQLDLSPSLDDLDFQGLYSTVNEEDIQQYLDNILSKFRFKIYDSNHEAVIGDNVVISVEQSVDGDQINYVDGGYISYKIGEPNNWFDGLDDLIIGQKVGYKAEFDITAPKDTIASDYESQKEIDISGKTVKCVITIASLSYEDMQITFTDEIAKQYSEQIGGDFSTVEGLKDRILKNILWSQVNVFKTSYALQFLADDLELSDELNRHLNLVAMQVEPGYDKTGPIYNEYVRVITSEFYNSLYEQLPENYKHNYKDRESVLSLMADVHGGEYYAVYNQKTEKDFPNEEQYADFIRQLQVLQWYVDNNYMNVLEQQNES